MGNFKNNWATFYSNIWSHWFRPSENSFWYPILSENCCGDLLGNFWKNWAIFPIFGHADLGRPKTHFGIPFFAGRISQAVKVYTILMFFSVLYQLVEILLNSSLTETQSKCVSRKGDSRKRKLANACSQRMLCFNIDNIDGDWVNSGLGIANVKQYYRNLHKSTWFSLFIIWVYKLLP